MRSQLKHKFDFVVSKNQEVKPRVLGLSHQCSTMELRPMVVQPASNCRLFTFLYYHHITSNMFLFPANLSNSSGHSSQHTITHTVCNKRMGPMQFKNEPHKNAFITECNFFTSTALFQKTISMITFILPKIGTSDTRLFPL